jgi:hypothetical protein
MAIGHRGKGNPDNPGVVFVSQDQLRAAIDNRARTQLGKSVGEVVTAHAAGNLVVPEKPETSRRVAALTRLLRE